MKLPKEEYYNPEPKSEYEKLVQTFIHDISFQSNPDGKPKKVFRTTGNGLVETTIQEFLDREKNER